MNYSFEGMGDTEEIAYFQDFTTFDFTVLGLFILFALPPIIHGLFHEDKRKVKQKKELAFLVDTFEGRARAATTKSKEEETENRVKILYRALFEATE
jgi:hypothetical protein